MRLTLLGGSNSVMVHGISSGLCSVENITEYHNFSLGASSSLQNLHALVDNIEIAKNSDLVVTESNINDSYNVKNLAVSADVIIKDIDLYYQILSHAAKKVLVIILPINRNHPRREADSIIDCINRAHLDNIERYGLDYINLAEIFNEIAETELSCLMPDARHVKPLLAHDLGKAIAHFYATQPHCEPTPAREALDLVQQKVKVLKVADFSSLPTFERGNSKFSATLIEISEQIKIPEQLKGYRIAGISTWGKGKIRIHNENVEVIKQFNDLKSFNEVVETLAVTDNTYIGASNRAVTEPSINVESIEIEGDNCPCSLESLLLIKDEAQLLPNHDRKQSHNRHQIVPDIDRYIYDGKRMSLQYGSFIHRLSRYLLKEGDIEEAEKVQRVAISANEKNAGYHMYLARLLKRRGDIEGAISSVRDAIRIDKNNKRYRYHLNVLIEEREEKAAKLSS